MRQTVLLAAILLWGPPAVRATADLGWPAPSAARLNERVAIDGVPAWALEAALNVQADAIERAPVLRADLGNVRYVSVGDAPVSAELQLAGAWATQPKWVAARADGVLVDKGVWTSMARWGASWDAQGLDRRSPQGRETTARFLFHAVADSEERWRQFAGLWRPALAQGAAVEREIKVFEPGDPLPVVARIERLADDDGRERLRARYAWTASSALAALAMGADAWTVLHHARPGHWLLRHGARPVRVEVEVEAWLDAGTRRPLVVVARRRLAGGADDAAGTSVFERRVDFAWRDGPDATIASADDRPFTEYPEPPPRDGRRDPSYRLTRMPPYPPALHAQGVGGEVVLRVQVGVDGRPGAVDVVRGSGHAELDGIGAATLREWRFWPKVADGITVESSVEVPLSFQPRAAAVAKGGR